jgi:hypothetical protein
VGYIEEYMAGIRWYQKGKRLVIPSWSVSPGYKIMLFPYRHGETLPNTFWNDDRTELTVEWDGQSDVYTFTMNEYGRTQFELRRNEIEPSGLTFE